MFHDIRVRAFQPTTRILFYKKRLPVKNVKSHKTLLKQNVLNRSEELQYINMSIHHIGAGNGYYLALHKVRS